MRAISGLVPAADAAGTGQHPATADRHPTLLITARSGHAVTRQRPAAAGQPGEPVPLLFLAPSTGGGHVAAANAVAEALRRRYPGRYAPVICDPLAGPGSAQALRWTARAYGPVIRYAPWLWGLLYRATDSPLAAGLVQRAVSCLAGRLIAAEVAARGPALVASFHPLTGQAAIRARDAAAPASPVVTVITDLGTPHAAWTWAKADRVVPATSAGIPVGSRFLGGPFPGAPFPEGSRAGAARAEQRGRLGHHSRATFLVLLAGGAEGAGGLARRAAALVRALPDVDIAVICGRNRRVRRRLSRLSARYGGRLSAHGFVTDMGGWLRAADVVATKAGPATIAEAACCGTPMVLTCYLPGQERGNVGVVTGAGAGAYWPRVSQLAAGIAWLRDDPAALAAMRSAAARLARPEAADDVAALLANLAASPPASAAPASAAPATGGAVPTPQLVLDGGQDA